MVAFFFSVSGFLLFKKINNNEDCRIIIKTYAKRILILYLFWSAVLFCFRIPHIISLGIDFRKQLIYWIKYLRILLFIGEYQLWYLIGLLWILLLFYLFFKKNSLKLNIIAAVFFWILKFIIDRIDINNVDGIIAKVLYIYKLTGNTTRNGLFTGYLFFVIGCIVAKHYSKVVHYSQSILYSGLTAVGCTALWYISSFTACLLWAQIIVEPVLVLSLLIFGISLKLPFKTDMIGKYSSIVFLSHMLFVLIISALFPKHIAMQLVLLLVSVTAFSFVLERASRKIQYIKYIY